MHTGWLGPLARITEHGSLHGRAGKNANILWAALPYPEHGSLLSRAGKKANIPWAVLPPGREAESAAMQEGTPQRTLPAETTHPLPGAPGCF